MSKTSAPVKLHYSLALNAKDLYKSLNSAKSQFRRFGSSVQRIFIGMQLGKYLFAGASSYIEEFKAKARTILNFKDLGFGEEIANEIFKITNNFEKLGYNAETANDAILQFVSSGRATSLRNIGLYIEKNTQSTLSNATAQQRLNWILENGNQKYQDLANSMPQNVKVLTEMTKQSEDLKKSLGATFLTTISNISNAFGGLGNTMKIALIAFTAYKIATIIGNVAIGISKTIAIGGIFAAPLAFAMGAAALASILALSTSAGIAFNSIGAGTNKIDNPSVSNSSTSAISNNINIEVKNDQYGTLIKQSSGGKAQTTQTTYGSGTYEN